MYLNLSKVILPRKDTQHGYPLDLDGSERWTRPYVIDTHPYPPLVHNISGMMRRQDGFFLANYGQAKTPFGPNINSVPNYAEYQIAVSGLTKKA